MPMKTLRLLTLATAAILSLPSCVTTTTTAPDGTVTVERRIDLPAFNKGADTLTAIAVAQAVPTK